jgi:hypothetical protein
MGGKTSSRWPKGYKREPSVEETWVIDCKQFERFFKSPRKTQLWKIPIERKSPAGFFHADFVLKNDKLSVIFTKHGKRGNVLVCQKINIVAVSRQGFFAKQYFFICPHCGEHFRKLYMRDDERYNDDEFCCRNGIGLTYASRLRH